MVTQRMIRVNITLWAKACLVFAIITPGAGITDTICRRINDGQNSGHFNDGML